MSILSAIQAAIVDKMLTDSQKVKLGESIRETQLYAPVIITYDANSDHSTAKNAFVAPFAMRIDDITVKADATNASGTLVPQKGTDAMCTGITCAADGAVSRMAAGAVKANDARLILAAGDVVKILSSGGTAANTRGFMTFWGHRL